MIDAEQRNPIGGVDRFRDSDAQDVRGKVRVRRRSPNKQTRLRAELTCVSGELAAHSETA